MTQLPLWAVYAVAFGTPLSALLGVLLSLWLTRSVAGQTDRRGRREEMLRNLRWSAEMAASDVEVRRRVGVGQLVVWGRTTSLDAGDQAFVDAALHAVLTEGSSALDVVDVAGESRVVVRDERLASVAGVESSTTEGGEDS